MMAVPGPRATRRGRVFYGWVIVALSWANQALGYTVWYSFSIFFVALIQEFGWDRASTAAVFSVFVLVGSLAGPLVGRLVDRFGPRLVLPLGATLTTLGVGLCARIDQPWQFYLAFGVLAGVGMASIGLVPNNAALSRWFSNRLGVAAGLASTGVGVGIFLFIPALQAIIGEFGWRVAYLTVAASLLGVLVPLNLLLQRRGPRDLGMEIDGEEPVRGGALPPAYGRRRVIVDEVWATRDWTITAAAATSRFWLLFAGLGAATFAQQLLVVHQVAYLIDAGQPPALAAAAAGLFGAFAVPAKIMAGAACDRYGREVTFAVGTGAFILAFPLLVIAGETGSFPLLLIYAALLGVGLGTIGPIAPGMIADVFAGPSFGEIFGAIIISTGIGAALGAWFAGWIYDLTGDYRVAFAMAILSATLAIVLCWLAAPRKVRRVLATG